ncbi:MAG: cell division protein ZapE, partial [Gammaproteobacteria bacterium]
MTPITPLERYALALKEDNFSADPEQAAAIAKLDALYRELISASRASPRWSRLIRRNQVTPNAIKGLYLWGGVGRGKTFVVDLFHGCLSATLARRVHFHSFMREIHHALKETRGTVDPLRHIAQRWAQDLRVLCLDEFHVVDITDAMLLGQLLAALFQAGVTLVTTTNEAPDALYKGGLQRDRFLPAIALLKAHLEIFEFTG